MVSSLKLEFVIFRSLVPVMFIEWNSISLRYERSTSAN